MKHSKMWTPIVLGTCLLAAVSCGSDDDDSSSNVQTPPPQQEEQQDQGTYTITFQPLNAGVAGNAAAGTGTITISEQTASVNLNMTGVPARINHLQHIFTSGTCPTPAADVNGDGFIDVLEGVPSYGPILIPLDGNLNTQADGSAQTPRADSAGTYSYNRTAVLPALLADLQAVDTDPTDAVGKLPAGENLNLEGRTVIIHGVPDSSNLPETVGSLPNVDAARTLPIACGTITRSAAEETTTGGTTTGTTVSGTTTGN
jgi:hypothetical protein